MFDPQVIKKDFPVLQKKIHGKPLVYLDNAATSQKPQQVIDAISNYYQNSNANVHRGVHQLSEESTTVWEKSRETIANFFGADESELILVRNTTEAINGVAYGWALDHLKKDDVILSTEMEHHSDLVVWQEICKRTGAKLEFIPVNEDGRLDLEWLGSMGKVQGSRIKLVALTHVSNTLGTVNPIQEIVADLRSLSSDLRILIDGAQAVPHLKINFHKLNVDFFTFSGHKMLGPMGAGGLLVRKELLKNGEFRPWLFGGGMIEAVYVDKTTFHENESDRFTAGTPDVASAVGLASACEYLQKLGMEHVEKHDCNLVEYTIAQLQKIPEIQIVGPTKLNSKYKIPNSKLDRIGSVAFLYEGVHPHDVAQILDSEGIAVRSGHHCTMPLHTKFNWAGTTRVSFQVYNDVNDVDALIEGLQKVKKMFARS